MFLWFRLRRQRLGLTRVEVSDLVILVAAGIMVGGRVFDILVYELDWYRAHPAQALNWWRGGMASHGVLLGALAAGAFFAWQRRIPLLVLLDEFVVPGAFLLAIGRIGNFIEGGVIGSVTTLPWGVIYPDLEGARHPVALYAGLKNLLIVPVLIWALRLRPAGAGLALGLFLLLYGGLRVLTDLFRDYEAVWLGLGTGQVFNLAMAGAGALWLLFIRWKRPEAPRRAPPPDRPAGFLRAAILAALILYPLGIPTSWTTENIREKRASALEGPAPAD